MTANKAVIDTSVLLKFLIKDDPAKAQVVEKLLKESKSKDMTLYVLPVTVLETVWVTEKVFGLNARISESL